MHLLEKLEKKKLLIHAAVGACVTILYMIFKSDREFLVRISDALFAGCLIPALFAAFYWMKSEKKAACLEPLIIGVLYFVASVIFMVIAM